MANRSNRLWLEVLKFLSPKELLLVDSVCHQWKACSRSDEVWQHHVVKLPHECRCFRDVYRAQLLRPEFIACLEDKVIEVYYPRKQKLKALSLSEFEPRKHATWVSLLDTVFYCGGEKDEGYLAACFLLSFRSKSVQRLPDMARCRSGAGLAYFDGRVYVLGGMSTLRLKQCEKFTLATQQWSPLPSMSLSRASFVPARLHSVLYIAGGTDDKAVELFSLGSETFTQTSLKLRIADFQSTALVQDNTLVVMAGKIVCKYSLQTGKLIKKVKINVYGELENDECFSPAGTIEFKDMTYLVLENMVIEVPKNLKAYVIDLGNPFG